MSTVYVPRRLHVLRALKTLIAGAHWKGETLAGRVTVGKIIMGDEVPSPHVNILETVRPDFPAFGGESEARADNWVLLVQGFVDRSEGDEESEPAYQLQAEVEIQLAKPFLLRPDSSGRPAYPEIAKIFQDAGIFSIQPYPPVVRQVENVASRISFYQPVTVGVSGLLTSPFVEIKQ